MTAELRKDLLGHYSNLYRYFVAGDLDQTLSLSEVRGLWRELLASSPFGKEVGIHVHIPFCRRRCSYCDCSSQVLGTRRRLERHLDLLSSEMEYLRDTFRDTSFTRLYVGGGTPNLLFAPQLRRLASEIQRSFRLRPEAVRCIEFAPGLSDEPRLEAARAGGFDRISFGVQSLDPQVLAAVNRPSMTPRRAQRAVALARAVGFEETNVDLIFGLASEPTRTFRQNLGEVASWEPQTITIQLLASSEVGRAYSSRRQELAVARRFVRFADSLAEGLGELAPGFRLMVRPRTLVLVHRSMVRPVESWLDFYSGQDRLAVSTLGLGRFAQSWMHTAWHVQNMATGEVFDPEARQHPARRYTPALQAALDCAMALMNEGRCDLAGLKRLYGPATEALERELELLSSLGRLEWRRDLVLAKGGRKNPLIPIIERLGSRASIARAGPGVGRDDGRNEGPRPAPVPAEDTPDRPGIEVPFRLGGLHWFLRAERASMSRRYFAVVRGVGIYYGAKGHASEDARRPLAQLMEGVRRRLWGAGCTPETLTSDGRAVGSLLREEIASKGGELEPPPERSGDVI